MTWAYPRDYIDRAADRLEEDAGDAAVEYEESVYKGCEEPPDEPWEQILTEMETAYLQAAGFFKQAAAEAKRRREGLVRGR